MNLHFWHVVFVAAMAYILWNFVALYPLKSHSLKQLKLPYVNFGLLLAFSVLCFACVAYMYYSASEDFPKVLLEVAYMCWTITLCAILWLHPFSKATKIIATSVVIGTLLLHYLFRGELRGISGFIQQLDNFTWVSGGESGKGLKLSVFLKWTFFFFNSFIVLSYYGKVFEVVHREKVDSGDKSEGLQEEAITRVIVVLSISVSVFIGLALSGTDLRNLSLFSGLVAAGVSVALKDLLANMAAGMLLLWDKSIKTNDVIALDKERFGVVKTMTIRYLVLEDRNDIRFLVPNSELINKTITNWTQRNRRIRLKLDIGVAFDSDPGKVRKLIRETCLRVPRVLHDPPPRILILGMGESTINFQLRFFIDDPENGVRNVIGELYELILARFKEAEIQIPFPRRDVLILPADNRSSEGSVSVPN